MSAKRCELAALDPSAVERLSNHSLYSSSGFLNLWRTANGRPVAWITDQEQALLAGVEFGSGPFKRFQAAPDGCYLRLVTDGELIDEQSVSSLLDSIGTYGYAKVFLHDYDNRLGHGDDFDLLACSTTLVDISAPDWEPPDSKLCSEIRKAEREGVQVQRFDADRHFDQFLELMKQTEARHERPPKYSAQFFQALAELAAIDQRVIWTWVEDDGRPAASHIYLIDGDMAFNWQVYFDKATSSLKPNQFTLHTIARQLAKEGVRWMNLGATPPGSPSVAEYKAKWGGVEHRYSCLCKKSWLGRIL